MDEGGDSTPQSKDSNIKNNNMNKIILVNKSINSGANTERETDKNNNTITNTINSQKSANKESLIGKNKTKKKSEGNKKVYENMIGPKDDVANITERINKLKKCLRNSVESGNYNYTAEK